MYPKNASEDRQRDKLLFIMSCTFSINNNSLKVGNKNNITVDFTSG